jgi:hypothetical protein
VLQPSEQYEQACVQGCLPSRHESCRKSQEAHCLRNLTRRYIVPYFVNVCVIFHTEMGSACSSTQCIVIRIGPRILGAVFRRPVVLGFLSPSRQMLGQHLALGCDRFSLHFVRISLSAFLWYLCCLLVRQSGVRHFNYLSIILHCTCLSNISSLFRFVCRFLVALTGLTWIPAVRTVLWMPCSLRVINASVQNIQARGLLSRLLDTAYH